MSTTSEHTGERATRPAWRGHARRLVVLVLGCALVVAGAALLVLPGPGAIVIFGGLALLSTEFAAARRAQTWLLRRVRRTYSRLVGGSQASPPPSEGVSPPGGVTPPPV